MLARHTDERARRHRRLRCGLAVLVCAIGVGTWLAPTDAGSVPRTVSKGCRRADPVTPNGPSATANVVQSGGGDSPEVEMVRYPRPERAPGGSNPWSQWGQGLVLDDGRFLSAIGDHRGQDGNSYLFVYEPGPRKLTRFTDILSLTDHQPGDWGYGKIHSQIVRGPCATAYFATYWGTRAEIRYNERYSGDALFRIDTSTLETRMEDVPVAEHGVPSIAAVGRDGLVYGEAVDPFSEQPNEHEEGAFFVYDMERKREVFRSDDSEHSTFRNVLLMRDGRAFVAAEKGRMLEYEPGESSLRDAGVQLPGGGDLRATTAPTRDGTVYGVTQYGDPANVIFALSDDGEVRRVAVAEGYTASLAATRDGSRLYYVPGAHGDAYQRGTPVIEVDTETGERRTVVELNPLAQEHLGLTLGGSYNVALDEKRNVLYVGANAGEDRERPWGEVVLVAVSLPSR